MADEKLIEATYQRGERIGATKERTRICEALLRSGSDTALRLATAIATAADNDAALDELLKTEARTMPSIAPPQSKLR